MENITWKDVLDGDKANRCLIQDFGKMALKLNYPYICWNDRLYRVTFQACFGTKFIRNENNEFVIDENINVYDYNIQ